MKIRLHVFAFVGAVLISGVSSWGASPDPRLVGFRTAEPAVVDGAPVAPNLLEQARLSLAASDMVKHAVLHELLSIEKNSTRTFVYFVISDLHGTTPLADFLTTLENARTDKQVGAGANTAGTTSLVSKPSAPAVIGAAVEQGTLVQTLGSGTQATFTGNVVGIGRLLLNQDVFPFCPPAPQKCQNDLVGALKHVSVFVSVDAKGQSVVNVPVSGSATSSSSLTSDSSAASTSTPTSVNLLTNAQRISAWGLRYSILNPHALDSAANQAAFRDALKPNALAALKALDAFFNPPDQASAAGQKDIQAYRGWLTTSTAEMEKLPAGTSVADFEQALIAQLVALENILKEQHPDLLTLAESARRAMDTYLTGREQALQTIANGVALSLEYTNNHPLDEPGTSDFRFVLSLKPSQYVTLTANAAASIYNSLPSGTHVSLYRDAQAALQLDLSLSQWEASGRRSSPPRATTNTCTIRR